MEFKQIQYFMHLTECRSFTEAADKLFISQQALSKCIKQMEHELGVRLFDRSPSGIHLTHDGEYLKSKFFRICMDYNTALSESYNHFNARSNLIEFAVCPGFFRSLPISLLLNYKNLHPECELEQLELNDLDCQDYVRRDSHNVALSTKPWHMNGLDYIPLHKEQLQFIVNKKHPLAASESIKISDLKDDKLLVLNKKFNIYYRILNLCKKAGFSPQIAYMSADVSQLVRLASEGLGVFICVEHIYKESSFDNLVCIPIADSEAYWEVGIITQLNKSIKKDIRQFMSFLLASCKTD